MTRRAGMRRAAAAAMLALAGCSGGDDTPDLELEVIKALENSVKASTAARQAKRAGPAPVPTRAELDKLGVAILEGVLERRDIRAFLPLTAQRRTPDGARITVWSTDTETLTMREGVLVGTHGIGRDIASAQVTVTPGRPGPSGGGERVYMIHHLDNKLVPVRMACDLADMGPETVEIIGRRHATRHLRETCAGGTTYAGAEGRVVNDYWVDSRRGEVVQSRQWAGPGMGYMRFRRLTD